MLDNSMDPKYSTSDNLGRKWMPTELPRKISDLGNGFDFTIVSCNILADKLLRDHVCLNNFCPKSEKWILEWDYKKNNLLKELFSYNADVSMFHSHQIFNT